jgi:hypothetical protein
LPPVPGFLGSVYAAFAAFDRALRSQIVLNF